MLKYDVVDELLSCSRVKLPLSIPVDADNVCVERFHEEFNKVVSVEEVVHVKLSILQPVCSNNCRSLPSH